MHNLNMYIIQNMARIKNKQLIPRNEVAKNTFLKKASSSSLKVAPANGARILFKCFISLFIYLLTVILA